MRAVVFAAAVMFVGAGCSGGGSSSSSGSTGSSGNTGGSGSSSGTSGSPGTSNSTSTSGGTTGAAGTATETGSILGSNFTPLDALSHSTSGVINVLVVDFANACSLAMANPNANKASSSGLTFTFPSMPAVGAQTLGGTVTVNYSGFDSACHPIQGESAMSGTVNVTRADASEIDATFNLTMGSSDAISGSFTAPNCDYPAPTTNPTCM
ncbi:MAG: hypothetical protein JST54_34615 [Deltaproteobacteria bacterium]|nr:hypothetical protein [Deltaproteobacteria bacterium]